jgi:hypothetical protein
MLAARLVADVSVVDGVMKPDAPVPAPAEAAEFLRGVHHLVGRLTSASIGIGKSYGGRLPDAALDQFRLAVQHMQAVLLDPVADALERLPAASRPPSE